MRYAADKADVAAHLEKVVGRLESLWRLWDELHTNRPRQPSAEFLKRRTRLGIRLRTAQRECSALSDRLRRLELRRPTLPEQRRGVAGDEKHPAA